MPLNKKQQSKRRKKHRRSRFRGIFVFFLVMALGVSAGLLTDEGKRTYDLGVDIVRQTTWKLRKRFNLPLPGIPDLAALDKRLKEKNLTLGSPIYMRIFKRESKLELWMKRGDRFEKFQTYPICRWSGKLGPKLKEGDRQSPEGFYSVSRGQLNPNSRWYRSFNLGYPNRFDRAHKRTGSFIMVHGGCSSIGCFAMTNPQMHEIWGIVNAALDNGQKQFGVHVFPFHLTKRNMQAHRDHKWAAFWRDLQPAYQHFNQSKQLPFIHVCHKRYKAVMPTNNKAGGSPKLIDACPAPVPST